MKIEINYMMNPKNNLLSTIVCYPYIYHTHIPGLRDEFGFVLYKNLFIEKHFDLKT